MQQQERKCIQQQRKHISWQVEKYQWDKHKQGQTQEVPWRCPIQKQKIQNLMRYKDISGIHLLRKGKKNSINSDDSAALVFCENDTSKGCLQKACQHNNSTTTPQRLVISTSTLNASYHKILRQETVWDVMYEMHNRAQECHDLVNCFSLSQKKKTWWTSRVGKLYSCHSTVIMMTYKRIEDFIIYFLHVDLFAYIYCSFKLKSSFNSHSFDYILYFIDYMIHLYGTLINMPLMLHV